MLRGPFARKGGGRFSYYTPPPLVTSLYIVCCPFMLVPHVAAEIKGEMEAIIISLRVLRRRSFSNIVIILLCAFSPVNIYILRLIQ